MIHDIEDDYVIRICGQESIVLQEQKRNLATVYGQKEINTDILLLNELLGLQTPLELFSP